MDESKLVKCGICKKEFPAEIMISGYGIMHELEDLIKAEEPFWTDQNHICENDFQIFRKKYIVDLIEDERGKIEHLEQDVLNSIQDSDILSKNLKTQEMQMDMLEELLNKIRK